MRRLARSACLIVASAILGSHLAIGSPAWGFDPADVYKERALVLSGEAGYGSEMHIQDPFTGLDFVNFGVRLGLIPFGIAGPSILQGALEVGLEPIYPRYVTPVHGFDAGLAGATRRTFT